MEVKILSEHGYSVALFGLGLNHGITSEIDFYEDFDQEFTIFTKLKKVANKLSPKDEGHNKFLESIIIWIDVDAPRSFWQEADTYRLSTKQSQSTMHLQKPRFENDTDEKSIQIYMDYYNQYKENPSNEKLLKMKHNCPEGLLQRRVWCMSYKTLRNIYKQRKMHKYSLWQVFLNSVLDQLQHQELIIGD